MDANMSTNRSSINTLVLLVAALPLLSVPMEAQSGGKKTPPKKKGGKKKKK